jgi:hypothetical protein
MEIFIFNSNQAQIYVNRDDSGSIGRQIFDRIFRVAGAILAARGANGQS